MQVSPTTPLVRGLNLSGPRPSPEQAVREFEALLIAQLLKSARKAALSEEASSLNGSEHYFEFAERHLAEVLADSGTFGFRKMLLEELGVKSAGR